MPKAKVPAAETVVVTMELSEYGTRQPSLMVAMPKGTYYRLLNAKLHELAAKVEVASHEARAQWCVQTKPNASYEERGRVYLELANDSTIEAKAGMAVLRSIVQGLGR